MVNATRKSGLGRTLQRVQRLANDRRNPRKSARHTVETTPGLDNAKLNNLRSVTDQTNLDEFFEEAELAGRQFITERRNVSVLDENNINGARNLYDQNERLERQPDLKLEEIDLPTSLCVPRRPKWDENTTAEQLDEYEKLTFLTWRKKLAKLQDNENVILTPFEKNLEVWRQLWRVVERSDIIVQILDCRNPLLYVCDDLIKYVQEEFDGKKMALVLLNKADYLSVAQRKIWYEYFRDRKIKAIFFSALLENDNLTNKSDAPTTRVSEIPEPVLKNNSANGSSNGYNSTRQQDSESENQPNEDRVSEKLQNSLNLNSSDEKDESDEYRVYDKFELIDTWRDLLDEVLERNKKMAEHYGEAREQALEEQDDEANLSHQHIPTVGLVGYPNVGKSSTINALLSAKRVAVSATPGKTKHFQTLLIDENMMLCDCPGLVFPNFVSCKDEMVINGVLPIDQMKDCVGPVRLIVSRIPRAYLEEIYGLAFEQDAKQNITADDLLNSFGFMRGYMTARGLPDVSRAARKICKDYINGKILYCEPPPNADKKLYHSQSKLADAMKAIEEKRLDPSFALRITERQRRLMRQAKGTQIDGREFDAQYFNATTSAAHIKGLPGIGNLTAPLGRNADVKLDKREKKHKKREKLRIVYRELDI